MIKEYSKAMKFYIIAHLALIFIYFISYSFLKVKEGDAIEVAKLMFAIFSGANVLLFIISNQLNSEKKRSEQINGECIFYALLTCVAISVGVAYLLSTIAI